MFQRLIFYQTDAAFFPCVWLLLPILLQFATTQPLRAQLPLTPCTILSANSTLSCASFTQQALARLLVSEDVL
jgi:hypothetical protein